jgi:hypothetical protein
MSRRWQVLLLVLPIAGCLQEGPVPAGRHLFHGQRVESPGFIQVGDEVMVRFEDRLAFATTTQGGVSDLWVTSFDGTSQRKVVANRSDYWGEQGPDNAGDRYFMVDEHLVPSPAGEVRAGTLVRLGPTLDDEFRLDGIVRYALTTVPIGAIYENPQPGQTCPGFPSLQNDCPQLFYERPTDAGQAYPTLMLWDGANHLPIGADSGSFQIQVMGSNAYFLLDDKHTLTRFRRPSYALDSLRSNVVSFSVSGDEHYVALSVTDDNKSKTVIRDLTTGAEIALGRPNPSAWGGFSGSTFHYSQNATASAPAEIHTLDLTTGEDKFVVLPSPLVNLVQAPDRCSRDSNNKVVDERCQATDERLLLDSLGHGVFTSRSDLVARRTLSGPLLTPSFTSDGKYLVYISPATATLYDTSVQGPLMFQDADLTTQPPTMVSPPGLLVNAQNGPSYFFTDGDKGKLLVFWAHLGRASSDLFFADYPGGGLPTGLRQIAKSIFSVSVSAHTLFGILNMSQQDGVGDLVLRDIDHGTDIRYAQGVADVTQCPPGLPSCAGWFTYIVKGRTDSDRSGLWLVSPALPDGGTN